MKSGLRKLAKQHHPNPINKRLLIATDCLSLVLALDKGPINQKDPTLVHIWSSIYKRFDRGIARIAIQWVPAHCGIRRNKFADARAKILLTNRKASDMRKVTVLHVFNDCIDLQIQLLREEYHAATTKAFTANTLCTDRVAAH